MIVIILFIFIIVLILAIALYTIPSILARRALKECIDKEGYVERWNAIDKRTRNSNDVTRYIKQVRVPSIFQQIHLKKLVSTITEPDWLKPIPWKFLMFDPGEEGGMPHTHGPYIMLPMLTISAKTLLHEKIHVYQRFNTAKTIKELAIPITGFVYPENNHRANPDTNRILFSDIRPVWKDTATKLNDINDNRDHPFELMAYALS